MLNLTSARQLEYNVVPRALVTLVDLNAHALTTIFVSLDQRSGNEGNEGSGNEIRLYRKSKSPESLA